MKTVLPIVPWIGGKRRLAKYILPLFPEHTCYVEPFCGGAALFFLKKPGKVEVINDINGDLMNLYRVVKHHPDEFLRQFEWSLVGREEYDRLKSVPAETLTDMQYNAQPGFIICKNRISVAGWGVTSSVLTQCALRHLICHVSGKTFHGQIKDSSAPVLSIWAGGNVLSVMIARIRCSTVTRRTGEQKATAWIFH